MTTTLRRPDGHAPARHRPSWRLAWLIPAGIALLSGLDAALLLLGVSAPITTSRLPQVHGMLLALGFVGTLIALERATALGRWYGFIAPALLGLSGVALIADPVPLAAAKIALTVGSGLVMLLYVPLWRRQYDAVVLTELLGAGLALIAAILWIGQDDLTHVLPWLIAFLVLTIGAERVELARITMGSGAGRRLLLHAWSIVAALIAGLAWPIVGAVALGVALLLFVAWLVTHDIARRTIRATGVTRYMAACILSGYLWLFVASAALLFGPPATQPAYDTVVHAVFLGYTFSMIMAHATTILPAVLHIALPYRPTFWVPFGLLQLSLLVRLWIGDGFAIPVGFQIGGVLGVAALLIFLLTALGSAVIGPRRSAPSPEAGG
jgi:hypothetical protein